MNKKELIKLKIEELKEDKVDLRFHYNIRWSEFLNNGIFTGTLIAIIIIALFTLMESSDAFTTSSAIFLLGILQFWFYKRKVLKEMKEIEVALSKKTDEIKKLFEELRN